MNYKRSKKVEGVFVDADKQRVNIRRVAAYATI
jgi:hypothetical protein